MSEFRNKMRKRYLEGTLPEESKFIVEAWDCDQGKKEDVLEFQYPRMYPEDLKNEPLSLDVRRKFMEEKNE